jgi:hypothetical protein
MATRQASRSGKAIGNLKRQKGQDPARFWLDCYFRIQCAGVADRRFYHETFDQLDTIEVLQAVEIVEQHYQLQANDYNHAISILLPFFAEGSNRPSKYLPYPPKQNKLDKQTIAIIKRLLSEAKLNRQVVAVINQLELLQ